MKETLILNAYHGHAQINKTSKNVHFYTNIHRALVSFSLSPSLCLSFSLLLFAKTGQHVINGSGGWFRMLMWFLIKLIAPNGSPRSSGEGLSITAVRLHPSHSAWQCHFTFSRSHTQFLRAFVLPMLKVRGSNVWMLALCGSMVDLI